MLRELPFQTIGDIGRHGLELHVYCPSCYSTRRPLAANLERSANRCFATARFRCTGTRHTAPACPPSVALYANHTTCNPRGEQVKLCALAAIVIVLALPAAAQTDNDTIRSSSRPRFQVVDGDTALDGLLAKEEVASHV
jgi:hypothetical protein